MHLHPATYALHPCGHLRRCSSPANAFEGWVGVVVRTAVYAQSTPARLATFYYYGDVRISTLTPSNAPVNGGTEVEVRGTGFIRSGSSILCAFRTVDEQGFPAIAVTRAMYAIAIPVHTADQIQHIAAPHSSTAHSSTIVPSTSCCFVSGGSMRLQPHGFCAT